MLQGFRPREARTIVLVACRMNRDGQWSDACIHNVSSRGVLVASDAAPARGSYVELRRGTLVVIGRVMWRHDRFFGLRTQDRVSVNALVSEPRLASRPVRPAAAAATDERRSNDRLAAEGRRAVAAERHRHLARLGQFAAVAAVVAIAAGLIGSEVYALLHAVAARIEDALS